LNESDRVPMVDLAAQYRSIEAEVQEAILRVIQSARFVLGPEGAAFEREMADLCGVSHAVGVGSGTDALEIALRAMGIGGGDEVVLPAFTFVAPAGACLLVGAKPVFADVCADTFCIDVADVERRLTPRTKAIIAVDLYGQVADLEPLERLARDRGLFLIEDAAQSVGASRYGRLAGAFGDCACVSFYPSKNLGAYGEGGMILTNSEQIAEESRRIRNHGTVAPYEHGRLGRNSRLDEIQAAVLRVKLRRLLAWTEERRRQARLYDELLDGSTVTTPAVAPGSEPNCYLYTIRSKDRDRLSAHLGERGISSVVYYPKPLHVQAPFVDSGQGEGDCPEAEQACREVLSVPLAPELSEEQIRRVAAAIRDFGRRS
jgi:dTDP-4-amino-4,6-dideoxygalactose transaminase